MRYDFDRQIDRRNTNSYKWDIPERHMGCGDVLGMWTADMDFQSPAPMLDALRKRLDHGVLGYTIRGQRYYFTVLTIIVTSIFIENEKL